jgi:beta-glucosidase
MTDDQAVGDPARRDAKRRLVYEPWLQEAAQHADFLGVQNYGRSRIDANGVLPPPPDAVLNQQHEEFYPASLEGAVIYAHQVSGKPIIVTENGIATADDTMRVRYIPLVMQGLGRAIAAGVPVLGYVHWSLLDNFEWIFGYGPKLGLCSVDHTTFKRTPKPSAYVYRDIVKRNGAA